MKRLIEKLDENRVPLYIDPRGSVKSFGRFSVKDLHIASMQPGAVRGNHSHLQAEVISVIDGSGICEIEVSDEEIVNLVTVGDAVRFITEKLNPANAGAA